MWMCSSVQAERELFHEPDLHQGLLALCCDRVLNLVIDAHSLKQ
jgi:hypothetical protein